MVGAPFEGSWDSVAGAAYYTGAGSGEVIWVVVSADLTTPAPQQALWLTRKRALT